MSLPSTASLPTTHARHIVLCILFQVSSGTQTMDEDNNTCLPVFPHERKTRRPMFTDDIEALSRFATSTNKSLFWLKTAGKRLGLIINLTSRFPDRTDRVGFGLSTKVFRIIQAKIPESQVPNKWARTLFKFGLRKNGFFHPSKSLIILSST